MSADAPGLSAADIADVLRLAGVDETEIQRAAEIGALPLLAVEQMILDDLRYDIVEIERRTGLTHDRFQTMWTAPGFAAPAPGARISNDDDLEQLRFAARREHPPQRRLDRPLFPVRRNDHRHHRVTRHTPVAKRPRHWLPHRLPAQPPIAKTHLHEHPALHGHDQDHLPHRTKQRRCHAFEVDPPGRRPAAPAGRLGRARRQNLPLPRGERAAPRTSPRKSGTKHSTL